jgi:hypothetical protein
MESSQVRIILDPSEKSSDSSTPPPRLTDPWTHEIDTYMKDLRNDSEKKQNDHAEAGHHFRRLEIKWALPSILSPAVCAPLILLVANATNDSCAKVTLTDYVATVGFAVTAFFTTIHNYFRYGNRTALHNMYSAKYSDIVTDIDSEIIKKRRFRAPADVFMATMKMKYDNLVFGEPIVPKFIEKSS